MVSRGQMHLWVEKTSFVLGSTGEKMSLIYQIEMDFIYITVAQVPCQYGKFPRIVSQLFFNC